MQSDDRFGMVDLNQPYPGYLKGSHGLCLPRFLLE